MSVLDLAAERCFGSLNLQEREALAASAGSEVPAPWTDAPRLALRCLSEAGGDLSTFVRLMVEKTRPPALAEEIAASTAEWEVQVRRWLWKNFPAYRKMVGAVKYRGRPGSSVPYPLAPMKYPGQDGAGAARTRAALARRRYNKKRGIVACQAVVEVDAATGASVTRLVGSALELLRRRAPHFVALQISGQPWYEATPEAASRWCETRSVEARFISAMCSLTPDPRRPFREQITDEMVEEALAVCA